MGATELTIANGTDGQWNKTDIKMFMKDIGDLIRVPWTLEVAVVQPAFSNTTYQSAKV